MVLGQVRIEFSHGQYEVFQPDNDGHQVLVATFGTLAAAQEAFPQAHPEASAIIARPAKQKLSRKAKWLIGCGIGFAVIFLLLVAVAISALSNPIDY